MADRPIRIRVDIFADLDGKPIFTKTRSGYVTIDDYAIIRNELDRIEETRNDDPA